MNLWLSKKSNGFISLIIVTLFGCASPAIGDETQLNGIVLGAPRSQFLENFYYYTGEESFYQDYPTIRESLLNNIRNGFREGVYEGQSLLNLGAWQAHSLTLIFYQEMLYKAQWSFKAVEGADVNAVASGLIDSIEYAYGKGVTEEYPEFTVTVWEGEEYRLQTFQESDLELSVEFKSSQHIGDTP